MNALKKTEEILSKILPLLFIILTFFCAIKRIPFFDEAYAYTISQLKLSEIFFLSHIEGHPVLWYLMLKLTSININFYPYNILILNWIISSVLIIFFWKKAPFNIITKALITFSYPFFNYYGVVARPYTFAVLVIFLICSLYKDCLKKPFLFSFLIILCANISVMSAIGAIGFSFLFLLKIFKEKLNKKDAILSFIILFSGALFFIIQLYGAKSPDVRAPAAVLGFVNDFLRFLVFPVGVNLRETLFFISSIVLVYSVPLILLKKNKEALYFIIITYFLMSFMFFKIYTGAFWHYFFYFIYLICAFWISYEKIKDIKFLKIAFSVFLFFSLSFVCYVPEKSPLNTSSYREIYKLAEYLKDDKLFCADWYGEITGLMPYFTRKNIAIYDEKGYKRNTLNSMVNTYNYFHNTFDGREFVKHIDKTRGNYLLTNNFFFHQGETEKYIEHKKGGFIYKKDGVSIYFQNIFWSDKINFAIYKVGNAVVENEK